VSVQISYSPARNRFYERKFDHDEARRRHAAGEGVAALARDYGVSYTAVQEVVDSAFRERAAERSRISQHTTCERCGAECLKETHRARRSGVRRLCRRCIMRERRECVRVDEQTGKVLEVYCSTCKSWKPPDAFGRGSRYKDLREGGFHSGCRPCLTKMRQEYRERHKVACAGGCGRMVEGKGRPNTRTIRGKRIKDIDPERPPLCSACWHKSPAGQAVQSKAVTVSAQRRRRVA
jgi:hypothetical protein